MANIPNASESVVDPGLGITGAVNNTPVVVGTTSSGTANQVVKVATQKKLVDTFGEGPAVEAASHILATAGGPVLVVRTATTTAASNGTVNTSGAPTSPAITVSGNAVIDSNVRVEIVAGGILGAATFRYSLDSYSGDSESLRTYSGVLAVPAGGTYAIPTLGITITFPAGTYVADHFYTVTVNCAAANSTDVTAAFTALDTTALAWRFAYLVTSNNTGDTTAHQAIGAAVQASLTAMATNSKYRAAMMPSNMDDADPLTVWTDPYDRLLVLHGRARSVSPKPFIGHSKPVIPGATVPAARAAGSLISTDLKRVPGNGLNDGGPVPNIVKLFVDERAASTGVDDIRLSTLRTYLGRSGFYITQGRIKSADGSDFTLWPRRIVMDVACETAHEFNEGLIGTGVRTNDDGTIDERDALSIEERGQARLEAVLLSPRNAEGKSGHVSAVKYQVSRLNNVLATSTIEVTVAIKPLSYPDYITANMSFVASIGATEAPAEEG